MEACEKGKERRKKRKKIIDGICIVVEVLQVKH